VRVVRQRSPPRSRRQLSLHGRIIPNRGQPEQGILNSPLWPNAGGCFTLNAQTPKSCTLSLTTAEPLIEVIELLDSFKHIAVVATEFANQVKLASRIDSKWP
jgi:hypothetical protein